MDEAVERILAGGKGGQFAAITADDGYRDNVTEALPILEKHGAPIAIYVAPGLIDGTTDLWWDVVEAIVDARDSLTVPAKGGAFTLDCSTPAKKLQANVRLHDHLALEVPEEEQCALLRELA
jgi:peptidoglycan/xylan/chitin deacetylase (PgdA/CDA1 family)